MAKALGICSRRKPKPDGSIYEKGLANYNTAICLTTLLHAAASPQDEPLITAARRYIVGQQAKGMADESLDGGIGYGAIGASPKRGHPDLDNTLIALEALRNYKTARPSVEIAASADLIGKPPSPSSHAAKTFRKRTPPPAPIPPTAAASSTILASPMPPPPTAPPSSALTAR